MLQDLDQAPKSSTSIFEVPKVSMTGLCSYRLVIALLLLIMFNIELDARLVGDRSPALFLGTLISYGVLNAALLSLALTERLHTSWLSLFAGALVDIVALNLLIQASGSQTNALSLLFIVAVIGAANVLSARLSLLIAALATLSVLGNAIFKLAIGESSVTPLATAGTLGLVFFIAAIAVQQLVSRAARNEALARRQAEDILELQQLNERIVQRMRTGILVIDKQMRIRLLNEAAKQQLGIQDSTASVVGKVAPDILQQAWTSWSADSGKLTQPFKGHSGGPDIRASFSALADSEQTLVFLEDTRQLSQQAQQLKLASLGRLTASIAHEIRNPLGAISHAAQLLGESQELAEHDKRFTEIIESQCRRMNYVVENVLSLSRRNTAKPEELELHDYMAEFIANYPQTAELEQTIKLIPAMGAINVTFDPRQLDQILTNLVENGLRYSLKKTGKSMLRVELYIEPATELPHIDIIDYGSGIDEDMEQHIFEPFFTTENDGTGLGLYLARELCEVNQAQLSYIRTITGSSCFRVSFAHPKKRWAR